MVKCWANGIWLIVVSVCIYPFFWTHPETPTGLITPSNSITAYENWPPSNVSISFTQPLLWYDGRRGWMVVKELGRGRSWYLQTATPCKVAKSILAALWARLPRHDTSDHRTSPQVPWQWLTFCQICISEIWSGCTFSGAWRDWVEFLASAEHWHLTDPLVQ